VIDNLSRVLAQAGSGLSHIIRQQIFVRNADHVAIFQRVRAELYEPPYPTSVLLVVAGLARPDVLVEILCEALVCC
jgi:enamine deaminase RidA (YjgF/YER057c/UK114 family)